MANDNESLLARLWRGLKSFEDAMDYSPHDYVFARLATLENEVEQMKSELAKAATPRARERAN